MKRWTRGVALMGLVVAVGSAVGCGRDPAPGGSDVPMVPAHGKSDVTWNTRLDTALERAEAQHKPVLVNFYADWCVWCKRLDDETFRDTQVAGVLAEAVIPVRLDVDGAGREVSRRMGVSGLPTTVVLAADGREIGRIDGYHPPDAFLQQVESILSTRS